MLSYPKGTRYTILSPVILVEGRTLKEQMEMDLKQGFNQWKSTEKSLELMNTNQR